MATAPGEEKMMSSRSERLATQLRVVEAAPQHKNAYHPECSQRFAEPDEGCRCTKAQVEACSRKAAEGTDREALPVNRFEHRGKWDKGSSFRHKQDRDLLTNPRAIQKIKDYFSKTEFDFDFWFVNSAKANKHTEVGQVDPNFPIMELGIEDFTHSPDAITIVFTNNKGDMRKPMTAWIIAHRMGHAARRIQAYEYFQQETLSGLRQLAKEFYNLTIETNYGYVSKPLEEKKLSRLFYAIGTMKSARDRNLPRPYEIFHELFAQYLIQGSVKLNPPPDAINLGTEKRPQMKSEHWRGDELVRQQWAEWVEWFESNINHNIEYALGMMVGKVFVM